MCCTRVENPVSLQIYLNQTKNLQNFSSTVVSLTSVRTNNQHSQLSSTRRKMQSGRNTVESAKESAADAAASAKAAMERAKATAKEKVFIYLFIFFNY